MNNPTILTMPPSMSYDQGEQIITLLTNINGSLWWVAFWVFIVVCVCAK